MEDRKVHGSAFDAPSPAPRLVTRKGVVSSQLRTERGTFGGKAPLELVQPMTQAQAIDAALESRASAEETRAILHRQPYRPRANELTEQQDLTLHERQTVLDDIVRRHNAATSQDALAKLRSDVEQRRARHELLRYALLYGALLILACLIAYPVVQASLTK